MYAILFNGVELQAGQYARVKRLNDGKFWNEATDAWDAAESASCNLPLTEGTTPGIYSGSASFSPANGMILEISVYDSGNALLFKTKQVWTSDKRTALQMVNDIQAELRLPQSPAFTYAHGKLVLGFVNRAQSLMVEQCEWPEMNLEGAFVTKVGATMYAITPVNASQVDRIDNIQIGDHFPMERLLDAEFRSFAKAHTTPSEPTRFRIYSRAGGAMILELAPPPDAAYAVDFSALMVPKTLVNETDIPLLDNDTVYLGGLAFARKEQGESFADDMALFQAKAKMQEENQSQPNWGDVETV